MLKEREKLLKVVNRKTVTEIDELELVMTEILIATTTIP